MLVSPVFSQPKLHLQQGSFTPDETQKEFALQSQATSAGSNYKILQFRQPTKKEYRQKLSENVEFLSYIPENAWLVKLKSGRSEILSEKKVRYLGPYRPEYKVKPSLAREAGKSSGPVELRIELFPEASKKVLEKYGELSQYGTNAWTVETTYSQINSIATEKIVRWITYGSPEPTTFNDQARNVIGADRLRRTSYNLTGDGFTAGVWDGGLADNAHEDLNATGKQYVGDSWASVSDHATHVTGTMAGSGNVNPSYQGVAPNASYVSYYFPSNNSFALIDETKDAVNNYDAILSQNSWGWDIFSVSNDTRGNYDYLGKYYDNLTRGYQGVDIPFIVSAGNEGDSFNPRYNTTLGPAGTAKNVITVGAVDGTGSIAGFSSWGPTDDGRIKPTLMADGGGNGNYVFSSYPKGSGYYPYAGLAGTSMAAPAVSGAVILLQEKFNETYSELAEPATVKAALIQTAKDLDRTGPDYKTGWGLVNATKAIKYVNKSDERDLIERETLNDKGDLDNYTVTVPQSESINFTLVWSDYPGTSSSSKALINDLDLVVRNAEGDRKYPWTLSWENRTDPALQSQEDHTNPVEKVSISDAETRKYTVVVNGTAVPENPQSYSLLMPSSSAPAPEMNVLSPESKGYGELPDFKVSVNDAVETVMYSVNGEGNFSMNRRNTTRLYNKSVELGEGENTVKFWANNSNDYKISEEVILTVDTEAPDLEIENPVKNANISGNFSVNATWNDEGTDVVEQSYNLSRPGFSKTGQLNNTVNSSKIDDGDYSLAVNVSDDFNNFNYTSIDITLDNTDPGLNSLDPKDGYIATSGGLIVGAVRSDSGTGIESSTFKLENESGAISKSLNGTVNEAHLSNSVYNLTYKVEDFAGNNVSEEVRVFYDTESPSLKVKNPENNSLAPVNFSIKAVYNDSVSGIDKANYSVSNGSELLTGQLNDTLDTSSLQEGEYSIDVTVYDNAGRLNSTSLNVTLDDTPPNLNLSSPLDGAVIKGNFSVNATYSDDVGVENIEYDLANGSIQAEGELNATVNSSKFEDGLYNLSVTVKDTAGNINQSRPELEFDNTPPEIDQPTVGGDANISGVVDVNFTFNEANTVTLSEFRLFNTTGNVTEWKELNYTGLNTSSFEGGSYNLSLKLNDSLGNFRRTNFTEITIDNTLPELSVKEFNLTEERNEWIKDNKTLELSCTDERTGVEQLSAPGNTSETTPVNFTFSESGKNQYSLTCRDYAGNKDQKEKTLRIDTQGPELESLSPEEGSTTSRSPEITAEFFNESTESGLNLSSSSLSISVGSLSTEWSNASLTASIEGLQYSESYSIEATLEDKIGHNYSFSAGYQVEEEPEDDSSGSGGGGGGGGFPPIDAEDDENESEEAEPSNNDSTVENVTMNSTGNSSETDDESESCQITVANDENCRVMDTCQAPMGWREVDNCSAWEQRRAEELINQLPEDGDAVSEARAEFENGNYSGAIQKALQAQESVKEKEEPGLMNRFVEVLVVALAVLIISVILLYKWYRKRKLIAKVEEYSEEMVAKMRSEGLKRSEKKEFASASEDIEKSDYEDALDKLKDITSQ